MLKLQNAILCLSLAGSCFTIGCMDHDREWAKKFDGLATNDPQLFVDWARLQLDMYEEQFPGFKQELESANEKGPDLYGKKGKHRELHDLQLAIGILRDKRRDMHDVVSKIAIAYRRCSLEMLQIAMKHLNYVISLNCYGNSRL